MSMSIQEVEFIYLQRTSLINKHNYFFVFAFCKIQTLVLPYPAKQTVFAHKSFRSKVALDRCTGFIFSLFFMNIRQCWLADEPCIWWCLTFTYTFREQYYVHTKHVTMILHVRNFGLFLSLRYSWFSSSFQLRALSLLPSRLGVWRACFFLIPFLIYHCK